MRYFTRLNSKLGMARDFSLSRSFGMISVAHPVFFQLMSCVHTYLHSLIRDFEKSVFDTQTI
jgi:hypothetical protein